jgi:hypothetical protein
MKKELKKSDRFEKKRKKNLKKGMAESIKKFQLKLD